MKRVRFLTPCRADNLVTMNDSDCHSPRPFVQRNLNTEVPELPCVLVQDVLYSPDPVNRFEYSDTSPYPTVSKTEVISGFDTDNHWSPSNELELSMLDSSSQQPRKQVYFTPVSSASSQEDICSAQSRRLHLTPEPSTNVLSPIENNKFVSPPNVLHKDDNFFITRGGLNRFQLQDTVQVQMNKMSLGKENHYSVTSHVPVNRTLKPSSQASSGNLDDSCSCHHCNKTKTPSNFNTSTPGNMEHNGQNYLHHIENNYPNIQPPPPQPTCNHCKCTQQRQTSYVRKESMSPKHPNAVDKKAWIIERYEQAKNQCTDVEKQMNVSKEKREPTVGDLLKIIKLQNEQLQLLQEKVDKLITTASCAPQMPIQNIMREHVAVETIDRDQHKISIGVMTSLEMVRTSTVINKELMKQTYDNAQIQCNRSEISIKEVVKQPVNLNFLDGILPVGKTVESMQESPDAQHVSNCNDEKTLNEQSLYNVHVDNATTPLMSPDQSLYLDVRDYSGSDSGSDHSNVGWTYYNKVMTHVNGMLQDSDMPSSASALYRNTRQQCVQMHIDKTNISVTKRVTFGDEPAIQSADTSLRMNQLAAKYLKAAPAPAPRHNEMSFATRNYMERHKIFKDKIRQDVPNKLRYPGF
ncbi:uncharacterized protein LOC125241283 [Leguminivora glycinivorella]|uniref:uncharacterized protein LOC125241283 n=1 Tax=Leguminivora glycinivorella TaxID=1035111 RepID=UPI002010AE3E|nr:uncharacterized protein LOC125241283 [Leguminivora glycinivorella]